MLLIVCLIPSYLESTKYKSIQIVLEKEQIRKMIWMSHITVFNLLMDPKNQQSPRNLDIAKLSSLNMVETVFILRPKHHRRQVV